MRVVTRDALATRVLLLTASVDSAAAFKAVGAGAAGLLLSASTVRTHLRYPDQAEAGASAATANDDRGLPRVANEEARRGVLLGRQPGRLDARTHLGDLSRRCRAARSSGAGRRCAAGAGLTSLPSQTLKPRWWW